MPERAWSVTTAVDGHREAFTVFAATRGKAAYETLLNASESYPDLSFKHIRVRSLGVMETPREIAERKAADFNTRYPVGTPIRVYAGAFGDPDSAYDTVVAEPGATILGHGPNVWVKVYGDRIALTHVVPLVLAQPEKQESTDGR